jgi:hypothetical protein
MKRPARWVLLALIILGLGASVAWAQPGQILIIRHAERPAMRGPFNLSLKGQERAMAYVPFFTHTPELVYCGLPVALFVNKIGPGDFSQSALETLTPLANHLRLLIDAHYDKRDYGDLAQEILSNPKYERKTVLICWDRNYIPKLAAALGVKKGLRLWPQNVFDRVWIITYRGDRVSLENMPQRLLFGDAAK